MSNIGKMTANEQLFTELTPEEGSVVEGGAASLYRHINQQGGGYTFSNAYSDLKQLDFNDQGSSITISEGEVWALYEHKNCRCQFGFLPAGNWNLKDVGFNDTVSSLRRYA